MPRKKKDEKFNADELISINMADIRKDLTYVIGDLRYNDSIYVVNLYKRPVGAIIPYAYLEKLIQLLTGNQEISVGGEETTCPQPLEVKEEDRA